MTQQLREKAFKIINKGLESIRPEKIIKQKIKLKKNLLIIKDYKDKIQKFNLNEYKKIVVIGFGKATSEIGGEIEKILNNKIDKGLIISTKKTRLKRGGDESKDSSSLLVDTRIIEVLEGTHPMPCLKNVKATKKLIKLIENLDEQDLIICLVAGGGSALLCYPNINFNNYLSIIKEKYKSGIDINEFNKIRKRLSLVKAGKLAKLTKAKIISLIFSDVVGDDLSVVASGPTVGKNLKNVKNILLVNNRSVLEPMRKKALSMGLKPLILTNQLKGEASRVGKNIIKKIKKIKNKNCFLFGGETTVTVKGKGLGGRNQELCLAGIEEIAKLDNAVLISLSTDGRDGPTSAAGAVIDEKTLEKANRQKLDYKQYLKDNNSYSFFKKLDDESKDSSSLLVNTRINSLIFIDSSRINLADIGIILRINKKDNVF